MSGIGDCSPGLSLNLVHCHPRQLKLCIYQAAEAWASLSMTLSPVSSFANWKPYYLGGKTEDCKNICKALARFSSTQKTLSIQLSFSKSTMKKDEADILEAGKPGADTEFIQQNNINHLFLSIVSLLKCVFISFWNYEKPQLHPKKGGKKNNEAKAQQISRQPI